MKPIKIMFVCHGNICRSPMAEFIFQKLAADAGLSDRFEAASAATSTEEIGNDMYPPAKRILTAHGIPFRRRAARQVTAEDLRRYDYLILMDGNNLRWMRRLFGTLPEEKIFKLMTFAGEDRDVSDPWYTDDFERAYADILAGCKGMLERLAGERYTYS